MKKTENRSSTDFTHIEHTVERLAEKYCEESIHKRRGSLFERIVKKLNRSLKRIVQTDSQALTKLEEHGLRNVSLEGDFVQMKPKTQDKVKTRIALWFQFLSPWTRLKTDFLAPGGGRLKADRFRRDSDIDRYLGIHGGVPADMNLQAIQTYDPFDPANWYESREAIPSNLHHDTQKVVCHKQQPKVFKWDEQISTTHHTRQPNVFTWEEIQTGQTQINFHYLHDEPNSYFPPISPSLTPRDFETADLPVRPAKRRRYTLV